MLVFNCTKAAADFFTVTRKGAKHSCIEPAPHKTIAESIDSPVFPKDVEPSKSNEIQWHWLVHCVSVKRKKFLLVMDDSSRYCLTFPTGKKGDEIEFLNTFEYYLKENFRCLSYEEEMPVEQIESSLDSYDNLIHTCAFHQRGDRSIQSNINEVAWLLEDMIEQYGTQLEEADLMAFNLYTGKTFRKVKGNKDYFVPQEKFLQEWYNRFSFEPAVVDGMPENVIDLNSYRK